MKDHNSYKNTERRNSRNEDNELDLSIPHVSRDQIQKILGGIRPKNLENYRRSLVHKSIQKHVRYSLQGGKGVSSYLMDGKKPSSNERLEFLGDAVFNLIVGGYLFSKFPTKDEGFLTRLRTKIVRDTHCVKFANVIKLGPHILAGPIVKRDNNGNYNDKLLEDAFEAFLGAIYLDLGFKFSNAFVINLIEDTVNFNDLLNDDNYKDILMRYTQTKGISLPEYKVIKHEGLPHQRIFTVQIILEIDKKKIEMGKGTGSCKKEAEQSAALATLNLVDPVDLGDLPDRDLL
jgi:ribonuclease-3